MKRLATGWVRRLAAMLMIAVVVGSGLGAASTPARAAEPSLAPFYARTLLEVQSGSSVAGIGWLSNSAHWVAYALDNVGCGHCQTYRSSIELINTLDTRKHTIHTSVLVPNYTLESGPSGATSMVFEAPYLVWVQPSKANAQGYNLTPGDYDCTVCYYNVETGQGGAVPAAQSLAVQNGANLTLFDVNYNGLLLALVSGPNANTLWTVNLGTGEKQPIATGGAIKAAVIHRLNQVAWVDDTTLYTVGPNNTKRQLATGVQHLQGTSFSLFWYTSDGIYSDEQGPQPTRVATGSADFGATDTSGALGTALAWVEPGAGTRSVLDVAHPNSTPIWSQQLLGAVGNVHLDSDNVVYIRVDQSNDLPINSLEVAWLVPAAPAFDQVWTKSDAAVKAGTAPRSWLWGPQPNYTALEAYAQGSGGMHLVQYYDKARMEISTDPASPGTDPASVTNGLLAVEMISGAFQVGNAAAITASVPCTIPVVGDPRKDNPLTPDYATLATVASLHGDHQAPNRVGQPVMDAIDVHGVVSTDAAHGNLTHNAAFVSQTGHNIPDVFWNYLQGMQAQYGYDWTFVLGYPIMDGYWTQMRVGGKDYPVLIQAYQRRVLTYIPDFAPVWQVQQGNVGQHYVEWRYTLNR